MERGLFFHAALEQLDLWGLTYLIHLDPALALGGRPRNASERWLMAQVLAQRAKVAHWYTWPERNGEELRRLLDVLEKDSEIPSLWRSRLFQRVLAFRYDNDYHLKLPGALLRVYRSHRKRTEQQQILAGWRWRRLVLWAGWQLERTPDPDGEPGLTAKEFQRLTSWFAAHPQQNTNRVWDNEFSLLGRWIQSRLKQGRGSLRE
jgi:hypothetical protein